MQKQWLIDGNNLMHKFTDISAKLSHHPDEARFLLAEKINRLCNDKGKKARIVFDGSKSTIPISFKNIKISYSHGKKADDIIIKRIKGKDASKRWIVVTDDREIISKARLHGVKTLSLSAFINEFRGKSGKGAKNQLNKPIEKGSNIIVSDAEVNEMLLFYKLKDSDERKR